MELNEKTGSHLTTRYPFSNAKVHRKKPFYFINTKCYGEELNHNKVVADYMNFWPAIKVAMDIDDICPILVGDNVFDVATTFSMAFYRLTTKFIYVNTQKSRWRNRYIGVGEGPKSPCYGDMDPCFYHFANLIHEVQHYIQHTSGRWKIIPQEEGGVIFLWDDQTITNKSFTYEEYFALPWEKDANETAIRVINEIFDDTTKEDYLSGRGRHVSKLRAQALLRPHQAKKLASLLRSVEV